MTTSIDSRMWRASGDNARCTSVRGRDVVLHDIYAIVAEAHEVKSCPYLRVPVMRRFERILAEAADQPLYPTEICAKIGVQKRTLRNHRHEYLGTSLHRHL